MPRPNLAALAFILGLLVGGCSGTDSESPGYVEVTFDGESCNVSPSSVPAGARPVVVTNNSDEGIILAVSSIGEGHTYEELIELQNAAGGLPAYFSKADWLQDESYSFDPSTQVPDDELADHQSAETFVLTHGTDAVYLYGYSPERLWFCGPLEIALASE